MNHEWQGPLQPGEKPPVESPTEKTEEKPENKKSEDVKNVEKELSPELIGKIMEKVRDINNEEIGYISLEPSGYSAVAKNQLQSIFKNGILGGNLGSENSSMDQAAILGGYVNKEKWLANLKSGDARFWFNIVGRGYGENKEDKNNFPIARSHYFRDGADKIAVLFDVSNFEEQDPGKPFTSRVKQYRHDAKSIEDQWENKKDFLERNKDIDEKGRPRPVTKKGFIGSYRVSPKLLLGVVFKIPPSQSLFASYKKVIKQRIEKIVKEMARGVASAELMVPIYWKDGALFWPKQMSYEEVKKFVAERDAKKQEKAQNKG